MLESGRRHKKEPTRAKPKRMRMGKRKRQIERGNRDRREPEYLILYRITEKTSSYSILVQRKNAGYIPPPLTTPTSRLTASQAHNPEVAGSKPVDAILCTFLFFPCVCCFDMSL